MLGSVGTQAFVSGWGWVAGWPGLGGWAGVQWASRAWGVGGRGPSAGSHVVVGRGGFGG